MYYLIEICSAAAVPQQYIGSFDVSMTVAFVMNVLQSIQLQSKQTKTSIF